MTKISSTTGGIRPPFGTDSTENIKPQSATVKESIQNKPGSAYFESVPPRDATGDKPVTGDLKVQGEQVKLQLNSKLETKGKEISEQPSPGFAPPLVPAGPVVTKDNIAIPGSSVTPSVTKQINGKADS
jgi:hypothetical protein